MRAPKLVQLMKTKSAELSEGLVRKIRASEKCGDLFSRVPESEHEQYALEIFQDLTQWLGDEKDSILEQRYVDLGSRRAVQGVPLCQLSWAMSIARESLWDYTQQECLLEEPVEFWGGVVLLRSLNSFFDRTLYFALLGYQKAENDKSTAMSFLAERRSA
jgi:hypothetical protein